MRMENSSYLLLSAEDAIVKIVVLKRRKKQWQCMSAQSYCIKDNEVGLQLSQCIQSYRLKHATVLMAVPRAWLHSRVLSLPEHFSDLAIEQYFHLEQAVLFPALVAPFWFDFIEISVSDDKRECQFYVLEHEKLQAISRVFDKHKLVLQCIEPDTQAKQRVANLSHYELDFLQINIEKYAVCFGLAIKAMESCHE